MTYTVITRSMTKIWIILSVDRSSYFLSFDIDRGWQLRFFGGSEENTLRYKPTRAGKSSSEESHSDSSSPDPPNSTEFSTGHFVNGDGTCNAELIDINHEKNTTETHYHGLPGDQVAMKFYDMNGNHMEGVDSGFSAGKTGEGPVFNTGVTNANISYIDVKIEHKNGQSQECKILVD